MQILLVEDDDSLAAGLKEGLGRQGFVVNHVATGTQALLAVETEPPDIVVLDLGLPDMDGMEVLAAIRDSGNQLPVLVLTARNQMDDKIAGLDSGADDYLAKPFDMQELAARLRAFERRLSSVSNNVIRVGQVELDVVAHRVTVNDQVVELPRREHMLLKALLESAGKVLTREVLEARLYSWDEDVGSNALEVHIHHLRKKMPEKLIKTVRGIGYTVSLQ